LGYPTRPDGDSKRNQLKLRTDLYNRLVDALMPYDLFSDLSAVVELDL
jgi:hypothetical protein